MRWPEKNHCPWIYREGQYTQYLLAVALAWAERLQGVKCGPCPQAEHGLAGETGSEAIGLGARMDRGRAPKLAGQREVPGANEGGQSRQRPQPVQKSQS